MPKYILILLALAGAYLLFGQSANLQSVLNVAKQQLQNPFIQGVVVGAGAVFFLTRRSR